MKISSFIRSLTRRKYVAFDYSPLPRVLTLLDLTALGVGSTIGVGFYILAGEVSRNTAGPAVTISFLIAAIASVFAGLCYAEFGARVPKAGSAYIYSYVCVGEFVAFVIGWNLILEYVIGTASVARGYSAYVDELAHNSMSEAFNRTMHMDIPALAPYPDFFAFGMTIALASILIIGVKESSRANNVFTGINIFVIVYVIVAGGTQADPYNWHLSEADVHNDSICEDPKEVGGDTEEDPWGSGGFAPYGFEGIMQGAATCFFGFVGFDIIATTGEEALRPERNIPLAISISLSIIFVAYFGMSTILTLALPYCMEDPDAPLIVLFDVKDMMVSKWIVSIGAIFGFSASLLGAMFPMPRIIYAMADDGLLFRFLSRINKRFKTPAIATALSGLLAGSMALFFTLDDLVDMMSIGTLMAYTIVSLCVMLLRYTPDSETDFGSVKTETKVLDSENEVIQHSFKEYMRQTVNKNKLKEPTSLSSSLVNYTTLSFSIFCFLLALFFALFGKDLVDGDVGTIVLICITFVITMINLIVIWFQPMSKKKLTFQVPLVPWIPALSTFINLYLMCNLSSATWIRFVVWMVIGLLIYFLYGLQHSTGSKPSSKRKKEEDPGFVLVNKNIPPIVVHPPTPWGSREGTPTSTVRPKQPKRPSVIESPLVTEAVVATAAVAVIDDNNKAKEAEAEAKANETLQKSSNDEMKSQSFDIKPRPLSTSDNSSSDSDRDEEGENDHKLAEIVTEATVYAISDSNSDKGEETVTHTPNAQSSSSSSNVPNDCSSSSISSENNESSTMSSKSFYYYRSDEVNGKSNKNNSTSVPNDSLPREAKITDEDVQLSNPVVNTSSKTIPADDPESVPVLRTTQSAPEFKDEEAFQETSYIPSSVKLDKDSTCSSEPGTPIMKSRHPTKVLVRASSFDNIPPSSVDSPFAKRVKKFVIIPVQVPKSEQGQSSDTEKPETESLNKSDIDWWMKSGAELEKANNADDFLVPLSLDIIRERGESKVSTTDLNLFSESINSHKLMEEFKSKETTVSA